MSQGPVTPPPWVQPPRPYHRPGKWHLGFSFRFVTVPAGGMARWSSMHERSVGVVWLEWWRWGVRVGFPVVKRLWWWVVRPCTRCGRRLWVFDELMCVQDIFGRRQMMHIDCYKPIYAELTEVTGG